jgi:hypothetical protein
MKTVKEVREFLERYDDSRDFQTLYIFLKNHPRAEEKLKGATSFKLTMKRNIFVNGDFTRDISWLKCLNPKRKQTDRVNVLDAGRYAVRDHVKEIKKEKTCPICNLDILDGEEVHVDHESPGFTELWNIYWGEKALPETVGMDGMWRRRFEDENISHEFEEFHRLHAHLRVVHAACNLRLGAPTRRTASPPTTTIIV